MISKLVILSLLLNYRSNIGHFLSCNYRNDETFGYTCDLTIQNPNGLNNFTSIGGSHLFGKTDFDVKMILKAPGSNTTNIPCIICDKFHNLIIIKLLSIGIQVIDENAFRSCKNLQILYLGSNNITKIDKNAFIENRELTTLDVFMNQLSDLPENVFKNQHKLLYLGLYNNLFSDLPQNIFNPLKNLTNLSLRSNQFKTLKVEWFLPLENLKILYLDDNQIEQLPRNIFMTLRKLNLIYLNNNKFKVINADPFRGMVNLKTIKLDYNKIEAIDERFIDNTGVQSLDIRSNLCVNQNIYDSSNSRISMRLALQKCFKNFDDLIPGKISNLEKADKECITKILTIENQNQHLSTTINELQDEVKNLVKENEDQNSLIKEQGTNIIGLELLIENQRSQIAKLHDNIEAQAKIIDDLKNLVNEILLNQTKA